MPHAHTQKVINRLSRIEGHIRAIRHMIEEDRPCPEVILQIVAARSALNKVAQLTLADHAEHCLVQASQGEHFSSELASLLSALDLLI